MIHVEVEAPQIGDPKEALRESMKKAQKLLESIVDRNFAAGGRPVKWSPLASGQPSYLYRSGRLRGSIRGASGDDWAEVSSGLPYARIHQMGGTTHPRVSERSRKYFWAMFYETKDEKWKWMALSRKTAFTVNIPARPFLTLTDEDVQQLAEMIGRDISAGIFTGGRQVSSILT